MQWPSKPRKTLHTGLFHSFLAPLWKLSATTPQKKAIQKQSTKEKSSTSSAI